MLAVEEADVILFVVDVMNGVTDLDMEVASILRRAKKPVLMVANKTDNNDLQYNSAEFYSLGLGDPYCISALSGFGTGDLMDLLVSKFKKDTAEELDEEMYFQAIACLESHGFIQYEISNFARNHKESLHNTTYWEYEDFLGLGCGAYGKENSIYYHHPFRINEYIDGTLVTHKDELDKELGNHLHFQILQKF